MSEVARQGPAIGKSDGDAEFRELADRAPVMIWRTDADRRFDWLNRPWLDFVGRPLEALIGGDWRSHVHPDDAQHAAAEFDEAFRARRPFSLHYRLRRHDGDYRWVIDHGAPFDRNGRFAGYFGSCVDISELFELQAHKDLLLAELNHRVKNNLQLVIAFLSFSEGGAESEEARSLLALAIRRIQGVGVVQEQLHESGDGVVDLGEYLPRVAHAAAGAAGGRAAVVTLDVTPIMSKAPQASSLGLVINELITNAVQRTPGADAQVAIRLAMLDDRQAELVITDLVQASTQGDAVGTARIGDLVEALARHAKASVTRDGVDGSRVRLVFPPAERRS